VSDAAGKVLSLVVPVRNGESVLPDLLASLENQTLTREQFEVIVVDDDSDDATVERVGRFGGVKCLRQARRGPGAARNLGMLACQGRVILFLDADCLAPPDLLVEHVRIHQDSPDVDVAGGSVTPDRPLRLGSVRAADHLCSWFNAHPGLPPAKVEYVPSLNMSIKRRVLATGVRWRETRTTGEDVAFCLDLADAGLSVWRFPQARVIHRDRSTLRGFLRHQYAWGHHGPSVRGASGTARFGWLFSRQRWAAALTAPVAGLGYAMLIVLGWWRRRPLLLLSVLPLILLGKAWYALGILRGAGDRGLSAGHAARCDEPPRR